MTSTTRGVTVAHRARRPLANRSSWTEVLVLSLFVAAPATFVAFSGYSAARGGTPSDDDLTARFLSHQTDFEALPPILDTDRARLPQADGPFDLADLMAAGAVHNHDYRALLAKIGAANIRYFPRSGNIVLPLAKSSDHFFADTKKSYLYLNREQPQPLPNKPSYARSGPGIRFVTEDHRIKGNWFIHHDGTLQVAFLPY
jgi:hypothetical protein